MKITLNCAFKTPNGEQVAALLFLNRTLEHTWVAPSNWIGKGISGDTQQVNLFGPSAIYLMEGDTIIGLVKGVGIEDIMLDIGDTGTGKFYSGVFGRYPVPLDFNWECVEAQWKSALPPASNENPAYIELG